MNPFFNPGRAITTLLLVSSLALVASPEVRAQAPAWQMAVAASGAASYVEAMAADASGSMYLVGEFQGTATFGTQALTSLGATDVFIAKWRNGSFVWAQRAGGSGNDLATSVAVSGTAVYVAGIFDSSTAGFGATVLANAGPAGTTDMFVAKLVDAGATASLTWVQRVGGIGNDNARALATAGTSVYVAGDYDSASLAVGTVTLPNAGSFQDVVVAKLVDAGPTASFAWAVRAGGVAGDLPWALAVRGADVFVGGAYFSPTADFGAVTLPKDGGVNPNSFVAKLRDAGSSASWQWAVGAGSAAAEDIRALAVSGSNVYVAGMFYGPTYTLGTTTLANAGGTNNTADGYVAKLTDLGASASYTWASQLGGPAYDSPQALAVQGSAVYATGTFFSAAATFGATTLANANASATTGDVFVAQLTDAGTTGGMVWAQRAGGPGTDVAPGLALSGTQVYVGGTVIPAASFGSYPLVTPVGGQVAYLASLTDATALAAPAAQPLANALVLAPNPAHSTTFVQLPAGLGASPATLTLLDALGRVVRTRTVALPAGTTTTDLDVAGLAPGVYALRVASGERLGTARLVVE